MSESVSRSLKASRQLADEKKKDIRLCGSFLLLSATVSILQSCASLDNYRSFTNFFVIRNTGIKTYDDYMLAANESVKAGDSETAIQMYRKAVEKAKSEYGFNDLRIATSASYLASYCESLGLLGDAEIYYKKALDVDIAALGPKDQETIRIKKALAQVLMKLFKNDEANKLLQSTKTESKTAK